MEDGGVQDRTAMTELCVLSLLSPCETGLQDEHWSHVWR